MQDNTILTVYVRIPNRNRLIESVTFFLIILNLQLR